MTVLLTVLTDNDILQKSVCVQSELYAHYRLEEWMDDLADEGQKVVYGNYSIAANWTPVKHVGGA